MCLLCFEIDCSMPLIPRMTENNHSTHFRPHGDAPSSGNKGVPQPMCNPLFWSGPAFQSTTSSSMNLTTDQLSNPNWSQPHNVPSSYAIHNPWNHYFGMMNPATDAP